MSVLSFLQEQASQAILSKRETSFIERSLTTLQTRLAQSFGPEIEEQLRFGSSTRGTILPRSMDAHSDIDYLVVFKDDGVMPQAYLDRLKRFALANYQKMAIKQSFPTVVLELNHIKFDLVPALRSPDYDYRIAGREGSWQGSNPKRFNGRLTERNNECGLLLKPALRLLKLWNAKHEYVYESYLLEKTATGNWYPFCSNLRHYFFEAIDDLEYTGVGWKDEHIHKAKAAIKKARSLEAAGSSAAAEEAVRELFR